MTIQPSDIQDVTAHAHVVPDVSLRLGRIAYVVPTLNEARHILGVIDALYDSADRQDAQIIVVDGGSTDGTIQLVQDEASRRDRLVLLHNPKRLQAAAVNLAVKVFGDDLDWIIRVDAHSGYPRDYCDVLLAEAERTGADSVVVRMNAIGEGLIQRNIAAAQNALFGNGGSAHRGSGEGRFVDHGHHALMRVSSFRAVGGYDEDFSHNEDAELDQRIVKSGFRIWLTAATRVDYYPRNTLFRLARQYRNFGAGRAATALKHPGSLHKRHFILIALAPFACLAALSPVIPLLALPFGLWLLACLSAGMLTALRQRSPAIALCGLTAAVMQMAWSFGFWGRGIRSRLRSERPLSRFRRPPRTMAGE